ncbi:MAG TPA: type II and III secretion system protein [Planctomycetota bacterium]|nr:type II and III secretion system protein [Planctomycetota bacterium]
MRRLAPAALVLLVACVTEEMKPPGTTWEFTADKPVVTMGELPAQAAPPTPGAPGPQVAPPVQNAPGEPTPDLLHLLQPVTEVPQQPDYLSEAPPSPFHRLGRNVIRGIDGSWSKMYPIKAERTAGVVALLQSSVPGFPTEPGKPAPADGKPTEVIKYVVEPNFYKDSLFTDHSVKLGILEPLPNLSVADLLMVTAPPEVLLFVDQLMDKVLADLPQVELQVRVVEVNLDDVLEWDAKIAAAKLENADAPFDPVANPIDGHFGAGFPIQNGTADTGFGANFGSFVPPTNLTGFLLSMQGMVSGYQVNTLLSFLQTIGASELISTPTLTVLNGHRALINTGSKVPVFSATGVGTNSQVTTTYQDTGVRVEMIPFIVAEDVVRIDVSVSVSAVTSEVPFVLSGVEVETPVISTRDTATTVHVHSGQAFSIGGLRARGTIESISKVPLLGDIPILGWLFKSRESRIQNTEILFFVTPTIHIPSETLVAPLGP